MYSDLFEEIGLSPNEAKIYETLLGSQDVSVSQISTRAKINRRNVYDAMNRLIEKGLVYKIFQDGENRFQAVNPEKLLDIVREKELKLSKILPDLKDMYDSDVPMEAAYIYKGVEGYKNYMNDLLRIGEETFFLGAKGLWFSPQVERHFLERYIKEFEKKGIKYFTLYDPRVKEKLPDALKEVGGNFKVLPDGFETPGVLDVFGDHIVTFTSVDVGKFGDDVTIFVMINPELAESFRTWFKFMWEMCPEYTADSASI